MKKFSGIDLHSNNSVVVVSDEADRIVYQRRLPNDPVQIRAALAPHREDLGKRLVPTVVGGCCDTQQSDVHHFRFDGHHFVRVSREEAG